MDLTRRVKELGRAAGFDAIRITSAETLQQEGQRYADWVSEGRQAEMRWITPEHVERSSKPRRALPGAASVICLALRYWTGPRHAATANSGSIARYAWGRDYHVVLGERLERFVELLQTEVSAEHRWYVDTGPMMDKALAVRSGLGWYGKNTNVLTPAWGSWVLLGEIVTTLELEPDRPLQQSCGSCRLCLVACPTGALGPDYTIDSRKCISYLTIEHRGAIPIEYRPLMGAWVFGCDICQDVCPPSMEPHLTSRDQRLDWASEVRSRVQGIEPRPWTDAGAVNVEVNPLYDGAVRSSVDLFWLLRLTHAEYLDAFRGTAVRRAKVWMLRRNAAVALGNVGTAETLPALLGAAREDEHPLVRSHSVWAIGRLAERRTVSLPVEELCQLADREEDDDVLTEIGTLLQTK